MIGLVGFDLHHRYRRRTVLNGLTVSLKPGQIVGLLGPNGAGKTTTFPDPRRPAHAQGGRVEMEGINITKWPLWRRARHGLAYVPQQSTVLPRLTVSENIDLGLLDAEANEREARRHALLGEFGLNAIAQQKGKTLSGGERKRVELARVFGSKPRYLLADEPFAGLDPLAIHDV